jgi:hypothetical protein
VPPALDRILLNPWVTRGGALTFIVGGVKSLIDIAGDGQTMLGLVVMIVGVGLMVVPRLVERQGPILTFTEPEVDVTRTVIGPDPSDVEVSYLAQVAVYNEQETGERAIARNVTPQVEIFDISEEHRITHYVGWSATNQRDFHPTLEQQHIYIAEKLTGDEECYAVRGTPSWIRRMVGNRIVRVPRQESDRLPGDEFLVRITLRGVNFKPVKGRFTLTNDRAGGGMQLEGLD